MLKVLVFDMDGTIADLYGVENWLNLLRAEDATPYRIASPLYDSQALNETLKALKAQGWHIVVTTWLAKGSTKKYDDRVRYAKKQWLIEQGFPYDELHMVKYGTPKHNITKNLGGFQILLDDNAEIRKDWNLGDTIDANFNILEQLKKLAEAE